MKKFWQEYKFVISGFIVWRILLAVVEITAPLFIPLRERFLGVIPWANMDGGHYLLIAQRGYGLYQQAFFPLYPLLIKVFSFIPVSIEFVAILISHMAFFVGILLLYKLFKKHNPSSALWAVLFLLAFPTSFFFVAVYPASILFMFSVTTFYFYDQKKWFWMSVCGLLASATSILGIFLFPAILIDYLLKKKVSLSALFSICFIPLGFICYMGFLYINTGDPLYFMRVQPEFGANRQVGKFILFPQVLWRYGKILVTASPNTIEYVVSVFELAVFLLFSSLTILGIWKKRISVGYIIFAISVLVVPTATGTFSSLPRYVLTAFPLFFMLGSMHNKAVKIVLIVTSTIGLIFAAAGFLQGYFIG